MSTVAVILAAGQGKQMKSALPTALHPILGDPALLWVLRPPSVSGAVVVVPPGTGQVTQALDHWTRQGLVPCQATPVGQSAPPESGDAVRAMIAELDRLEATRVLILYGDAPLLESSTVERLASSPAMVLAPDSHAFTESNQLDRNLEGTHPATTEWVACCLPWKELRSALVERQDAPGQGEFPLSDAVTTITERIHVAVEYGDPQELARMASRLDQSRLQAHARNRINRRWMEEGVTFLDPISTVVGPRVVLGMDVLVEPMARLEGDVRVGQGTRIGQGSVIRDSLIGAEVDIRPYCVVQQADVSRGVKLGPFAHLREGSVLGENVHVGNFVETKKAILHAGAKANHLSYLGDAEVGERTNIGAGFISCNYDGFNKHRTVIGKDVFVGSDVQLVAPVSLGDGAIIGAGSTITRDVPADALALTRAPLVVKESAAERLREKLRAKRDRG